MRIRPLALLFSWSCLSGCTETVSVPLPIEAGQSAIMAVRSIAVDGVRPLRMFAVDIGEKPPSLSTRAGGELVILTFEGPLASLGLSSGEVEREFEADKGRPLPTANRVYRLEAPNKSWSEAESAPEFLDEFLLPELETCDREDACVRFFKERAICDVPCPALSEIAPPPPVTPPERITRACPTGLTMDGVFCAAPPRRVCPVGQGQLMGDAACAPLVECATTTFRAPPNPMGTVVYVDATAVGGNGTEGAPFTTLADALQTAPPRTIVVAAGTYVAPSMISGETTIVGLCPERTSLGAITIAGSASVEIDGAFVGRVATAGSLALTNVVVNGGAVVDASGALSASRTIFSGVDGVVVDAAGGPTLDLAECVVEGTTGSSLVVAREGQATLTRTLLHPDRGAAVTVNGSAQLTLEEVAIVSVDALPKLVGGGQSTTTIDAVFIDAPTMGTLDDGAALTGSIFGVQSVRTPFVMAGTSKLTLDNLSWDAANTASLIRVGGTSTVRLSKVRSRGQGGKFIEGTGGVDIGLTDVDAAGFERLAVVTGTGRVEITRAESDGGVVIGASSSSGFERLITGVTDDCRDFTAGPDASRITVAINDLTVDAAGRSGVIVCAGTTATIENLAVSNGQAGVVAHCRQNCVEDKDVVDLTINGLDIVGDASARVGLLHRGGRLSLSKARIRDVELYGLYAWGSEVIAEDLEIDGVGANVPTEFLERDIYCSENRAAMLRSPGTSIFTEAWSSPMTEVLRSDVMLTRFKIHRSGCAAIGMGVDGTFVAQDGAIVDNFRGLNFIRFSEPTIAENVIFRNNTQADFYSVGVE